MGVSRQIEKQKGRQRSRHLVIISRLINLHQREKLFLKNGHHILMHINMIPLPSLQNSTGKRMKNKVLMLSNKLPYPSDDGSSIAMARLLETLVMKELDLHYYAINTDKHGKDVDVSKTQQPNITFEAFAWNTSPKPSTALGNLATNLPYHVSRFYIPTLLQRLKAFDTNSFHTVVLEGAFMGMYAIEAKRIGQQTILRAHNVEHEIWQRLAENEKNPLKRWYLKLQSRRFFSIFLKS